MAVIVTFRRRASIWGYVSDANSGAGLGGASVELVSQQQATETRADGFYAFLDLVEASYTLRVTAPLRGTRYGTVTVTGVVVARDATGRPLADPKANVSLPPTGLRAQVRRSDTLAPIAFADVHLRASGSRTKSNRAGQSVLSAVEAGSQTVQVSAPGFTALSQVVSLNAGQETMVEFSLTPG